VFRLQLCGVATFLLIAGSAHAELKPEQVAVIANSNSPQGLDLAQYYLQKRHIPEANLIQVKLPNDDTISREAYENDLVQPIRSALEKRGIAGDIRVLVTTYGVPIRVLAPETTNDEKQALLEALSLKEAARKVLNNVAEAALKAQGKTPDSGEKKDNPEESDQALVQRTHGALKGLNEYLQGLSDQQQAAAGRSTLQLLLSQFGGIAAVVQSAKIPDKDDTIAQGTLLKLKNEIQAAQRVLVALDETRTAQNRKRASTLASQTFGAIGMLGRADAYIRMYQYKEADASVDSELQLVWWDRESYLVSERLPNPYHYRYQQPNKAIPILLPVVMTSRIDAGTAEIAKQIIDKAIDAETNGLTGYAYFDARGLKADDKSFGQYDQSLRDAADLLDDESSLKVKLDNRDKTWSEPGDAPDAALYCGWYRLRHYEDAFTFKTGAVGYHIASEEAVSLHDPEEKGWCKNALDHGITATLGAVAEPYLDTFPLPLEFFGLLLTQHYSLVEVYALTSEFMSWRMMLIGDPLYRPKFEKASVTGETLADQNDSAKGLNPLPTPPSEQEFMNPVDRRKKLAEHKAATMKEVEAFYQALDKKIKEQQKAQAAAGSQPTGRTKPAVPPKK
jgi:uncharacterized protein (TIGR03790 family)